MLLLVLALGCHGEDSTRQVCETSDCRVQRAVELWETDPAAAQQALEALSPEERIAATSKLLVAHPSAAGALCEHLPQGVSAEWCEGLERRPHLWTELPEQATATITRQRTAPGPAATSALPTRPLPSTLAATPPDRRNCLREQSRQACQSRRASRMARLDRGPEAAAACLALPDPTWQQECFFRAAESAVREARIEGYPLAAELCALAGEFAPNCYWHTAMALATDTPAADRAGGEAWQGVLEGEAILTSTWASVDPDYGAHLRGFLWGRATSEAVASAHSLDGTATTALPLVAMPHLRAALAIELMRRKGAEAHDLAGWVDELWARLESDGTGLETPPPSGSFGLAAKVDRWPVDIGEDGAIPAVLYLGGSRRALARDRRRDLAICVVQAAAHLDPPAMELVEAARSHEDPIIAWTANRLIAAEGATN